MDTMVDVVPSFGGDPCNALVVVSTDAHTTKFRVTEGIAQLSDDHSPLSLITERKRQRFTARLKGIRSEQTRSESTQERFLKLALDHERRAKKQACGAS